MRYLFPLSFTRFLQHLQAIIQTSFKLIDSAQTSALRLANLEVLINAVLYNPTATLHLLEGVQAGASRVFFDKWFEAINADERLPRVHDKKLSLMALCALLEMEPSAVPVPVQEVWSNIVAGALKIFRDLPRAIEARKALERAYQDEDVDEEEEDDVRLLNLNEEDGKLLNTSSHE